jgi:hypothetical protein
VTAELIVPPDSVMAVVRELNAALPSTERAAGRVPSPRPKKFVRVRAAGGTPASLVHVTPTVLVESYATTDGDADDLARRCHAIIVRAARNGWMGGIPCADVGVFAMPADLPDPDTDQARSTATYAVTLRAA